MAYLTEKEFEKLQVEILDGSLEKPFFKDIPRWGCVAEFMGYQLKWDKTPVEEWLPGQGRILRYYCYPKYKRGHDRFEFMEYDVHEIYTIYRALFEQDLYDDELRAAWGSLEKEIMLTTLYRKINELSNSTNP